MITVKNRSDDSWGPLASIPDYKFNSLINNRNGNTKELIKQEIKNQKSMKTYRVKFIRELQTDFVEIQAESDWEISRNAQKYFEENKDTLVFSPVPESTWKSDTPRGYNTMRYTEIKK
jgi:hypothetical protein